MGKNLICGGKDGPLQLTRESRASRDTCSIRMNVKMLIFNKRLKEFKHILWANPSKKEMDNGSHIDNQSINNQ